LYSDSGDKILEIDDFDTIYFLSDVHLGQPKSTNDEERKEKLFAFGDKIAKPGNHFFLLGDLFDFWFEWKKVIPKRHFKVLREIAGWADKGLNLYYLPGNHDFRLGGFLQDELGFRTFKDTLDFTASGKKFHLFHGDGLMKSDSGYRFLKRVFRNRFNQWMFLLFHPDWGISLAEWSSNTSRGVQENRNPYEHTTDYADYAREKINGEGFDYVIMGHTHLPLQEEIEGGIYINTGNWYKDFTYAVFRENKLSLETFVWDNK